MKTGFVAVVGRPNVGKSTLLNKIIAYPVSITTKTPQTTRHQIKAIYNDAESQIVFVDTPGIHKPQQKLGSFLNQASFRAIAEADYVLFLTPVNELIGPGDKRIIARLPKHKSAAVITKVDKGTIALVQAKSAKLQTLGFASIMATTVQNKVTTSMLIQFLKKQLHDGPLLFNRSDITNVSSRFLIQEKIREAVIEKTQDELPHVVRVLITALTLNKNEFEVAATICVERHSQKQILIGKNGQMVRTIGTSARQKIKHQFKQNPLLNLKVKVDRNWTNNHQKIIKNGF